MKTILLVEDNDDIRESVAELLSEDGYSVFQAENGQVAIEQLEHMSERPSLMLLDLMMPVMNGIELLKIVHESGPLSRIPVVVLSAGGESTDVPDACKFMRKPVDYRQLLLTVDELCGRTARCTFGAAEEPSPRR